MRANSPVLHGDLQLAPQLVALLLPPVKRSMVRPPTAGPGSAPSLLPSWASPLGTPAAGLCGRVTRLLRWVLRPLVVRGRVVPSRLPPEIPRTVGSVLGSGALGWVVGMLSSSWTRQGRLLLDGCLVLGLVLAAAVGSCLGGRLVPAGAASSIGVAFPWPLASVLGLCHRLQEHQLASDLWYDSRPRHRPEASSGLILINVVIPADYFLF